MNALENIDHIQTPFYYYDLVLLRKTLDIATTEAQKYNYRLHYAIKANSNSKILSIIKHRGFGADCVSGNEIQTALASGFNPKDVVFAGVGKTDQEIAYAIDENIACFNCESLQEIQVINEIARNKNKKVNIAIRINPNINANTHHYITTGLNANKFGISQSELTQLFEVKDYLTSIKITGLHFHIGSQIRDLNVFKNLGQKVSDYISLFEENNLKLSHINLGGGLGIDYENPDSNPIPPFEEYFKVIHENLKIPDHINVHFEPGRSIIGQCGNLYTRVLYLKNSEEKSFVIVDAGLTELIRPALYQSYHKIENTNSSTGEIRADVVGPICESSDYFAKNILFPDTHRGDILRIYSTGAYGESMVSNYNLRTKVKAYYSDEQINPEIKLELAS